MLNNVYNSGKTIGQLTQMSSITDGSDKSYLVLKVNELLNRTISELEIEDFRILINQNIGLQYLVPPAIKILETNLFAEGDFFEGDLLKSVLNIDKSFWRDNSILKDELKELCHAKFVDIKNIDVSENIKEELNRLVEDFLT